jgi:hypothetical protein
MILFLKELKASSFTIYTDSLVEFNILINDLILLVLVEATLQTIKSLKSF